MRSRVWTGHAARAAATWLVLVLPSIAAAQPRGTPFEQVVFSGFSLGGGARPWGMGGAHLGVPGDPEAGSWNPAALSGLRRPWIAVSFVDDRLDGRPRSLTIDRTSGASGAVGVFTETLIRASGGGIADLTGTVPLRLGGSYVVLQVGYQRRVSYGYDLAYASEFDYREPDIYHHDYRYAAAATGGLDTVAVRLAATPVRRLRLGLGIERWFGGYGVPVRETDRRSFYVTEALQAGWTESLDDDLRFDVSAWSWTLGAQVDVTDWLVAAIVLRPGLDATVDYLNAAASVDERLGERFDGATYAGRGRLELPDAAAVGAAARVGDRLTVALDVTTTLWDEASFSHYARVTSRGDVPSPGTYAYPTMAMLVPEVPEPFQASTPPASEQRNTVQVHAGAEYALRVRAIPVPLRGGLFHDRSLVVEATGGALDAWGFTLGAGVRWRQVELDGAWVRSLAPDRYRRDTFRTSLRVELPAWRRP